MSSDKPHQAPRYLADLHRRLEARLGDALAGAAVHAGQLTIELVPVGAHDALQVLHDEFEFRQLVDLCGVDYLDFGRSDWETSDSASGEGFSRATQANVSSKSDALFDFGADESAATTGDDRRFAVVYHLLAHSSNQRLRVRVFAPGSPPMVASVVDIWACADWYEREAFDLFGVLFEGHPDLRRLLTDYGFVGHPFRRDFPLSGEVEVRYDLEQRRVVYEPVSIEPRTLVPRVIRRSGTHGAEPAETAPAAEQKER